MAEAWPLAAGSGWGLRMVAAMRLNDGGGGITAAQSTSLHCSSRVAVVMRREVAKGAAVLGHRVMTDSLVDWI
jgi:hypothetical protein